MYPLSRFHRGRGLILCPASNPFPFPGWHRSMTVMRKRREAHEHAIQFLFQYDVNPPEDLAAALDHF